MGEIKEFTGVSAPYEEPLNPEIILNANILTIDEEVEKVIEYLKDRKVI